MSRMTFLACVVVAFPILLTIGCVSAGTPSRPAPQRAGFVRSLPDTQGPLLGKEDAVSMRSGLMILQPGQDCGWHSTETYEELIICLAGAGEVRSADGPPRALAVGQYAYNPPHSRHNVFNIGTAEMRYAYVVAPARAGAGDHH